MKSGLLFICLPLRKMHLCLSFPSASLKCGTWAFGNLCTEKCIKLSESKDTQHASRCLVTKRENKWSKYSPEEDYRLCTFHSLEWQLPTGTTQSQDLSSLLMKRFQPIPGSQMNEARRSKEADSLLQFLAICPDFFLAFLVLWFLFHSTSNMCLLLLLHSYWHSYLCFRKPLWLYWPTHGVLDSFHFKILTPLQSANCHMVYILTGYENWSFLPQNGQRLTNSMNGGGYGVRPACFIQSEGSYRASNSEHTWSGNLEECKYLNLNVQDGKQSWQQYQYKALG